MSDSKFSQNDVLASEEHSTHMFKVIRSDRKYCRFFICTVYKHLKVHSHITMISIIHC